MFCILHFVVHKLCTLLAQNTLFLLSCQKAPFKIIYHILESSPFPSFRQFGKISNIKIRSFLFLAGNIFLFSISALFKRTNAGSRRGLLASRHAAVSLPSKACFSTPGGSALLGPALFQDSIPASSLENSSSILSMMRCCSESGGEWQGYFHYSIRRKMFNCYR